MSKEELLEVLREEGKPIAFKSAIIGLTICSIHFLHEYLTLLSEGEIIWEELVAGALYSMLFMVHYFIIGFSLKVLIMLTKK